MAFTVKIKNQYSTDAARSYCMVALPSVVVDENSSLTIQPGELMTPTFTVTDTITYDSVTSITFKYEYFAFVGTCTSGAHPKIERTKSVPVNLGSVKADGFVALVDWDDGQVDIRIAKGNDLEEESITYAPKGAIRIKCKRAPTNRKKSYVVGLAQRLITEEIDDEDNTEELPDPNPIAAVPYKKDKLYTIKPSAIMCIKATDRGTPEGLVLPPTTAKVAPIDFKNAKKGENPQVMVTETGDGYFQGRSHISEATLQKLFSGSSPVPPPQPRAPQQQPAHAPARVSKEKEQAEKLGFTSVRQMHAYQFLTKYNKTQLAGFHKDDNLKSIAMNAADWGAKILANDEYRDEYLDDLLVLALFDTILFLDNSKSIDWEPERGEQLQHISGSIVDVENIYDNTPSVRIEFLNGNPRDDTASTAEEARELIANIRNHGKTPLGTQLRRKILDRFVYPKLHSKGTFRPVLICIITDGDPQGEDRDQFKKEIQACKALLQDRDKMRVGEKHVLFQISQVGNDAGAIRFLRSLQSDLELKKILHITSYQQLDIPPDQEDPIFTYSAAISRLAGAAFVGLHRNEDGEFVFPES